MSSPDPDVSGRPTPMYGWSYHFYYYYIICAWAHLTQTFLAGPHRCVDDLQEQMARPRIEDEDGAVDGLRRQITFKCLKNRWKKNMSVNNLN